VPLDRVADDVPAQIRAAGSPVPDGTAGASR
jgi:hypothetical protein